MTRTIVITGASDGIGASAARALAQEGNRLVVVGRSAAKTKAVAQDIGADHFLADFTELLQVRELAAALKEKYPRIDVLANNAGGIMGSREVTVDGHEKTFQVNHLAPFLLTELLMEVLVDSQATIINTSSAAHRFMAKFDMADLDSEKGYNNRAAYGNAKLANILFTKELQKRHGHRGINAAAFHPGVVGSNFSAESAGILKMGYSLLNRFMLTPTQGAETLVWLASTEPGVVWTPGEYYVKRKQAKISATAQETDLARQLWERSEAMVASCDPRPRGR
ncbi:SDR family NAD(P)-dependent oxidoreductase [Specibacter sp. NPDC057265]|uniref:SDR family NAD(P)-dependent oxidoreductase n=1 Tax=Specibacter sp. NPDC057265 TaxID=3346075 RepID=UPI00362F5308